MRPWAYAPPATVSMQAAAFVALSALATAVPPALDGLVYNNGAAGTTSPQLHEEAPPCEPCVQGQPPCSPACSKDYLCPIAGPDSSCNASTPRVDDAVDVFVGGGSNYSFHRIPVLVQAADGTLLVFAQCGGLPANSSDVVLRRSSDGGRHWQPELPVVAQGFAGGPMLPISNPSPVVLSSGKILLVCTPGNKEVWTFVSTDGVTWSSGRNITAMASRADWEWVATGPPQGIQLTTGDHAGRIVIGADHRSGKIMGSHSIYSDDLGVSWRISTLLDSKAGPCESQVAPAPNGSLLINARGHDSARHFAWSDDGESN